MFPTLKSWGIEKALSSLMTVIKCNIKKASSIFCLFEVSRRPQLQMGRSETVSGWLVLIESSELLKSCKIWVAIEGLVGFKDLLEHKELLEFAYNLSESFSFIEEKLYCFSYIKSLPCIDLEFDYSTSFSVL